MILWTIISSEVVFQSEDTISLPRYEEIQLGQTSVVLEVSSSQPRIVRIIATDPQQYLRPELQPGAIYHRGSSFETLS